jgi:membrane protease YdiL (CAAX protease family)
MIHNRRRGLYTFIFASIVVCSSYPQISNAPVSDNILYINYIFPGSVQIAQGNTEGYAYLGGTAASIAGFIMQGPMTPDGSLENVAGDILFSYGESAVAYSTYSYIADIGKISLASPREAFSSLLLSPYDSTHLCSAYVLPLVGLTAINALYLLLPDGGMDKLSTWYGQSRINCWGMQISPWLATSLYMSLSLIRMEGVAIAEETLYRGFFLNEYGQTASTLIFGAVHMGNLFYAKKIDKDAIIGAATQTLSATCLGAILSERVMEDGGKLGEAVAIHFWWNLIASGIQLVQYIVKDDAETTPQNKAVGNISYGADVSPGGAIKLVCTLSY